VAIVKICSTKLTTCDVLDDGEVVRLDLVDQSGADVSLQLPFDQAQAMAMTLPSLLTQALKSLTGSATARYVFPLDHWTVEGTNGSDGLLLTLATDDGFHVCFGIPAEACGGLGSILVRHSSERAEADEADDQADAASSVALN
jgi:hypothetical protein